MTSTRLRGHSLLFEGSPVNPLPGDPRDRWDYAVGGRAKCSCGALSDVLPTTASRKRWHRDHKDAIRQQGDA